MMPAASAGGRAPGSPPPRCLPNPAAIAAAMPRLEGLALLLLLPPPLPPMLPARRLPGEGGKPGGSRSRSGEELRGAVR
jgi:hypothetical protein